MRPVDPSVIDPMVYCFTRIAWDEDARGKRVSNTKPHRMGWYYCRTCASYRRTCRHGGKA